MMSSTMTTTKLTTTEMMTTELMTANVDDYDNGDDSDDDDSSDSSDGDDNGEIQRAAVQQTTTFWQLENKHCNNGWKWRWGKY